MDSSEKAVPVAPGPSILHSGRIQQLSGKGLLQSGSWKKRYCVLDGQRLFFYQQDSSSDPSKEKTGHYIDLRCYDICEEAAGSIIKDVQRSRSGSSSSVTGSSKEQHVWVISSADIEKGSHRFFETGGRVYLSAGSLTEMNEWISQIRSAMTALRSGGVTRKPIQQRNSVKRIEQKANQVDVNKDSGTDMMIDYVGDNKTLDCGVVKQRAKGPTGRRLPRQQSRVFPGTLMEPRSESLSRLEDRQPASSTSSNQSRQKDLVRREQQQHNRSFDFGRPNRQLVGDGIRSTVYAYSSDEDEQSVMNISFIPATGETDEEMAVIETLCSDDVTGGGTGLHHAISTPALTSGGPSLTSTAFHSMPRRPKRRTQQPMESSSSQGVLQQPSSSSTDDDPPIWRQDQQLQLMKEAATIRAALAGLEADLGASRRDVGWLQENLTTVQNAAGQVADKVAKMQSTVANMERQISGAVKEAQLMQQRANEALQSASEAERDYRRLEGDCRDLLIQLRRAHRQQTSEALSISPMTPHGLMIQQPKAADIYSNNAFDFGSILSSGGATIKPVKSSLRCSSESRNFSDRSSINKSISFGPTTTFATSPMSDPEDILPAPAATSTLKKSAVNGNNHFLIFNQNSSTTAAIITP